MKAVQEVCLCIFVFHTQKALGLGLYLADQLATICLGFRQLFVFAQAAPRCMNVPLLAQPCCCQRPLGLLSFLSDTAALNTLAAAHPLVYIPKGFSSLALVVIKMHLLTFTCSCHLHCRVRFTLPLTQETAPFCRNRNRITNIW